MERKKKTLCIIAFVTFQFITSILAVASGGAGHGDYFWSRIFYPISTILISLESAAALVYSIGIIQFPIYSFFIIKPRCKSKRIKIGLGIIIFHLLFVILSFNIQI